MGGMNVASRDGGGRGGGGRLAEVTPTCSGPPGLQPGAASWDKTAPASGASEINPDPHPQALHSQLCASRRQHTEEAESGKHESTSF